MDDTTWILACIKVTGIRLFFRVAHRFSARVCAILYLMWLFVSAKGQAGGRQERLTEATYVFYNLYGTIRMEFWLRVDGAVIFLWRRWYMYVLNVVK
jgi:hypothetical protein